MTKTHMILGYLASRGGEHRGRAIEIAAEGRIQRGHVYAYLSLLIKNGYVIARVDETIPRVNGHTISVYSATPLGRRKWDQVMSERTLKWHSATAQPPFGS